MLAFVVLRGEVYIIKLLQLRQKPLIVNLNYTLCLAEPTHVKDLLVSSQIHQTEENIKCIFDDN